MTAEEMTQTDELMTRIASLRDSGLTDVHLAGVFLKRRIQPLQARVHNIWAYSGTGDATQVRNEELSSNELETNLRAITCIKASDPINYSPPSSSLLSSEPADPGTLHF